MKPLIRIKKKSKKKSTFVLTERQRAIRALADRRKQYSEIVSRAMTDAQQEAVQNRTDKRLKGR